MSEPERFLWQRIRRKQLLSVQFYRQKTIGKYIVDFYAPSVSLIIEVDGSQHFFTEHQIKDQKRDFWLKQQGFEILRFNSLEVFRQMDAVLTKIYNYILKKNPSVATRPLPLKKGENQN